MTFVYLYWPPRSPTLTSHTIRWSQVTLVHLCWPHVTSVNLRWPLFNYVPLVSTISNVDISRSSFSKRKHIIYQFTRHTTSIRITPHSPHLTLYIALSLPLSIYLSHTISMSLAHYLSLSLPLSPIHYISYIPFSKSSPPYSHLPVYNTNTQYPQTISWY